jgi:hypothetical protein
MSLDDDDNLAPSINAVKGLLERLATVSGSGTHTPGIIRCLLTNGNIEKQLKVFIGIAWVEAAPAQRAYVMDKKLGGAFVDLIAFEKVLENSREEIQPKFWMETKCTFAECRQDGIARGALNQAVTYWGDMHQDVKKCPGYIVHFLCSLPKRGDALLPSWVLEKYPFGNGALRSSPNPAKLEEYYKGIAKERYHSSQVFEIFSDPRVHAVVVRLGPLDAAIVDAAAPDGTVVKNSHRRVGG